MGVQTLAGMFLLNLLVAYQVSLVPAPIFSDGAVLQRGVAVPIFGEAAAGTRVTVEMTGQSVQTFSDSTGHWEVKLKPLLAGGPFRLAIRNGGRKFFGK